jgi:hypothetical protein
MPLEHIFPELPNIYLSQDIKSVRTLWTLVVPYNVVCKITSDFFFY